MYKYYSQEVLQVVNSYLDNKEQYFKIIEFENKIPLYYVQDWTDREEYLEYNLPQYLYLESELKEKILTNQWYFKLDIPIACISIHQTGEKESHITHQIYITVKNFKYKVPKVFYYNVYKTYSNKEVNLPCNEFKDVDIIQILDELDYVDNFTKSYYEFVLEDLHLTGVI